MNLPSDLSVAERTALTAFERDSEPYAAPVPVDESSIRHWCEAFEDGNPLYLDDQYARRQGLTGVIAPPAATVSTFAQPYRGLPGMAAVPRHLHFEVKEALGFRAAIVIGVEIDHIGDLHVGDRLVIRQRLLSVSEITSTRLGSGRHWTIERRYANQRDELIALQQLTAFGYDRQSDAIESGQDLRERALGRIDSLSARLDRNALAIGTKLPEMRIPVTPLRSIYVASATRDFGPQHCDSDYARTTAVGGIFVSTPFVHGMVSRYLSDWAGSSTRLRRVTLKFRRPVIAGEVMILRGEVRRYQDADLEIGLEIATERGAAINGSAVLRIGSGSSDSSD